MTLLGKRTAVITMLLGLLLLAAAPAAAYQATVRNTTNTEVTVEVFEVRFIGVFNSLGKKKIGAHNQATFNTNGAFCIYKYVGSVLEQGSSPEVPKFQTWEKRANDEGAQCGNDLMKVKQKPNGKFYFAR